MQPVLCHQAMTTTNSQPKLYVHRSGVLGSIPSGCQLASECRAKLFVFKMSCCKAIHNMHTWHCSTQSFLLSVAATILRGFCWEPGRTTYLGVYGSICVSASRVSLYHHRLGQHWARQNGSFCLCPPGGRGEGVHPGTGEDEFITVKDCCSITFV